MRASVLDVRVMKRVRRETKRLRRTPEEAREAILVAAERVFAQALPDSVGLKDIAKEAGVSHPLVSHYFGTYEGLVDATLERRLSRLQAEVSGEFVQLLLGNASGFELLSAHRRIVSRVASDTVSARLVLWGALARRFEGRQLPPSLAAMRLIADAVEMRGGLEVAREDLEFALFAETAMTMIWTYAKGFIGQMQGLEVTPARDAAVQQKTSEMIETYLKSKRRKT